MNSEAIGPRVRIRVPGRGRCRRLDAPHYIQFVILHTKYNEGRPNDSTTHNYMLRAPEIHDPGTESIPR